MHRRNAERLLGPILCLRPQSQARRIEKIITFILQSEPGTSLKAAGWTLEAKKAGKPRWNKERYASKPVQLTLFPRKTPPAEYKQRWSRALNTERKSHETDNHAK